MREIGPEEAYALAIEMDTLEGYVGFVRAYPGHPYTQAGLGDDPRAARGARLDARAARATRRKPTGPICAAIRTACMRSTPSAACAGSARPFAPPPGFAMMEFDDVPMALSRRAGRIRGGVSRRSAAAARTLWRAASGLSRQYAAAAAPRGGGAAAALRVCCRRSRLRSRWRRRWRPRRDALSAPGSPGAGGGNRQGGAGWRGGNVIRAAAPVSVAPSQPVAPGRCNAPARSTPNAAIAPSTVTPILHACLRRRAPGGSRPPGWGGGSGLRALPAARQAAAARYCSAGARHRVRGYAERGCAEHRGAKQRDAKQSDAEQRRRAQQRRRRAPAVRASPPAG